ncbi:MAG TPA: 6-pyruvoyl tetrahydrobiopterin synthase, partial [Planctomycetaceae bacterium]|nr:6-pyruvoyl tetrahydrobiopterin synthase [Planctomycetaceae bacterium]
MFYLMQEMDFCYGHRLLNYEGKCRNLHGHNGRLEILLVGEKLDSRGMLLDFGDIKRLLKTWIDDHLDHKMLLCREDPLLPVLQSHEQPV